MMRSLITIYFNYHLYINNCSTRIDNLVTWSLAWFPITFFECYNAALWILGFQRTFDVGIYYSVSLSLTRIYCSGTNSYLQ